jgi:hypothetical protein
VEIDLSEIGDMKITPELILVKAKLVFNSRFKTIKIRRFNYDEISTLSQTQLVIPGLGL